MEFQGGTHMRHCILALIVLVITLPAVSQSVRVDTHASKITLKGSVYDVTLIIASDWDVASATVKLDIVTPSGDPVARTSLSSNLKAGTSKLRTTIPLPQSESPRGRFGPRSLTEAS